MAEIKNFYHLAKQILGVNENMPKPEIRYNYYRLMCFYHPDKNQGEEKAHRKSALINEAMDVLLGKEKNPTLLRDKSLVVELVNQPVSDESILSYEEWLRNRFFNMEECSIWPY